MWTYNMNEMMFLCSKYVYNWCECTHRYSISNVQVLRIFDFKERIKNNLFHSLPFPLISNIFLQLAVIKQLIWFYFIFSSQLLLFSSHFPQHHRHSHPESSSSSSLYLLYSCFLRSLRVRTATSCFQFSFENRFSLPARELKSPTFRYTGISFVFPH